MSLADTARRLITKFGRLDGQLSRPSIAIDVPGHKPWAAEDPSPIRSPVLGSNLSVVVLDALTALKPEQLLPEQTAIAYIAAGLEPKTLDLLETGGKTYSVLDVDELAPGPTVYLYTLHLKGR